MSSSSVVEQRVDAIDRREEASARGVIRELRGWEKREGREGVDGGSPGLCGEPGSGYSQRRWTPRPVVVTSPLIFSASGWGSDARCIRSCSHATTLRVL